MKRMTLWLIFFVLVAVVAVEITHLIVCHWFLAEDRSVFQQNLVMEIQKVADILKTSKSAEEVICNLGGIEIGGLSSENVSCIPKSRRGEYMSYNGESFVPLDWTFYDIGEICGYRGVLRVGCYNDEVEDISIYYDLCGDE